jgi:hypothetical protein
MNCGLTLSFYAKTLEQTDQEAYWSSASSKQMIRIARRLILIFKKLRINSKLGDIVALFPKDHCPLIQINLFIEF